MSNTLPGRCIAAYVDATGFDPMPHGIHAVLEHLAAELVLLDHPDAARTLLGQLKGQVIPLRPERGGAA
jgi:hypothetical protein